MIVPRIQVIPFTVPSGRTLDLSDCTKYDHSKVVGVVLLPDKDIFGDRIYLEINRQVILPYGFNAGLISFRQFMNTEMQRSVYEFEEWAQGNGIRMIYTNSDTRSVNIEMLLMTVQNDSQPFTQRKKLQIVPVPFTSKPLADGNGYEPCEVRTKTDFYYDELTGVFNDHFNYVQTTFDRCLNEETKQIMLDFLALLTLPVATSIEEIKAKKEAATALLNRFKYWDFYKIDGLPAIHQSLSDYIDNITTEPSIYKSDMLILQESTGSFTVYDDGHKTLSTLGITVDGRPFFPENYPIANIIPRYRKSFKETMRKTSMQVCEADILIRFVHRAFRQDSRDKPQSEDDVTSFPRPWAPTDFNMYFLYNQTIKA